MIRPFLLFLLVALAVFLVIGSFLPAIFPSASFLFFLPAMLIVHFFWNKKMPQGFLVFSFFLFEYLSPFPFSVLSLTALATFFLVRYIVVRSVTNQTLFSFVALGICTFFLFFSILFLIAAIQFFLQNSWQETLQYTSSFLLFFLKQSLLFLLFFLPVLFFRFRSTSV